jgi:hypothetical protein
VLGKGDHGTTFASGQNVVKVLRDHQGAKREWRCMVELYKKLHKFLPLYVATPLGKFDKCPKNKMDNSVYDTMPWYDYYEIENISDFEHYFAKPISQLIKEGQKIFVMNRIENISNDERNKIKARFKPIDSYTILVYSNLGDMQFNEIFDKHPINENYNLRKRITLESLFQLLVFLIFLKRETTIVHNDICKINIILKKNNQVITFKLKEGQYQIQPVYLAYLIDYGYCNSASKDDDFVDLLHVFSSNSIVQVVKNYCSSILDEWEKTDAYIPISTVSRILNDDIFNDILL